MRSEGSTGLSACSCLFVVVVFYSCCFATAAAAAFFPLCTFLQSNVHMHKWFPNI